MGLGDGVNWSESAPTDATTANLIDDYDRDLRIGVRSRMNREHEWPASQSATSEGGAHKYITLQMQSTAPTMGGTQVGAVYQKTVATTGDCLFYLNAATQEVNISKKTYFWYLGGAVDTGANVSAKLPLLGAGMVRYAGAYVSTVASGGDGIQIDVLYNGNSLWTATASQIILAPGSTSTGVSVFATTAVAAGGVLTLDVDKIGSGIAGGNLTAFVEVW